MSASAWDKLFDLMVRAVMSIDLLLSVLVVALLVVFFLALGALVLNVFNHLGGQGADLKDDNSHPTSEMIYRLDEMARIAISRRPRTRKRHHRLSHKIRLAGPKG